MLYQATHMTLYSYQEPVAQCLNEVHLTPRTTARQRVLQSGIEVEPKPAVFERQMDYFGNEVATFSVLQSHDRLVTTSTSIVEVQAASSRQLPSIAWEDARHHLGLHADADGLEAFEFIFESPFVHLAPELAAYALPSFTPGRPLAEAVQDLSHRVYKEFSYKPKSTSIETPLAEVLRSRRGVCQDFAHVLIGALRSQRLAARYVSGYIRSGENVTGAEASHAWVSAFLPDYGWLDLDPTNDVIPSDGHITLAWGRDYGDVPPVKGIALGGGVQKVEVEVRVKALDRSAKYGSGLESLEKEETE
jgi:transglutaminase-like putative cysteine protease